MYGICLVLASVLCVCAADEPFVTAYIGHNVSIVWTLHSPTPLRYVRDIDIRASYLHIRCHTDYYYVRCDNFGIRPGELTTIPMTAMNNTNIIVTAIGVKLNNVTLQDGDLYHIDAYPGEHHRGVLYIFQEPRQPLVQYNEFPLLGHDLNLQCDTTSQSQPDQYNYRFNLNFAWTVTNLESSYFQNASYMEIHNIQKSDAGARISCRAQEENSTLVSDESPVLTLDVYYLEDIHFSDGLDHQEVLEGSNVTKTCQASCNPECQYQWVSETGDTVAGGHTIVLQNVTESIAHTPYICEVRNEVGTLTRAFEIIVVYKPEIAEFLVTPNPAFEGNHTTMACALRNNSFANITVTAIGSDVFLGAASVERLEHTWEQVDCALNGDYKCSAENRHGVVSRTLKMDIRCPPRINEDKSTTRKFELKLDSEYLFQVVIIANPVPNVEEMTVEYFSWTGVQLALPTDTFFINITHDTLSVTIPFVTENDYGLYSLSAHNVHGHMVVLFEIADPRPSRTVVGLSVALAVVLAVGLVLGAMWYSRKGLFNQGDKEEASTPRAEEVTKDTQQIYQNVAFNSIGQRDAPKGNTYESLALSNRNTDPEPTFRLEGYPRADGVDVGDHAIYQEVDT